MRISQIEKIQNLPLFLEKDHDKIPLVLSTAIKSFIGKYQSKLDYDQKQFDRDLENTYLQIQCYATKSQELLSQFQSLSTIHMMVKDIHSYVWMLFSFMRQQLDKLKESTIKPPFTLLNNRGICQRCQKIISTEKVKRTRNQLINYPFADPFKYYQQVQVTSQLSKQFHNGILKLLNQLDQDYIYPELNIDKFNQQISQLQSNQQRQSNNIKKCLDQFNQSQQKLINCHLFHQKNNQYKQPIQMQQQINQQFHNIIIQIYKKVLLLINKKRQSLWRDQQVQVNFNTQSYLKDIDKLKKKHQTDIKTLQTQKNQIIDNLKTQLQAKKSQIIIKNDNIYQIQTQNLKIAHQVQTLQSQINTLKNQNFQRSNKRKSSIFKSTQRNNSKRNTIKLDSSNNLKKIDQYEEIPIQQIQKINKQKVKKKIVEVKKNLKRSSVIVHKQARLSGLINKAQSTTKVNYNQQQQQKQKSLESNLQNNDNDVIQYENIQNKQISNQRIQSNKNVQIIQKSKNLTQLGRAQRKTTGSYFKRNAYQLNSQQRKSLKTLNCNNQQNILRQNIYTNITEQHEQGQEKSQHINNQLLLERNNKIDSALKTIHQNLFINTKLTNPVDYDTFKQTVNSFLGRLKKKKKTQSSKQFHVRGSTISKLLQKTVDKIGIKTNTVRSPLKNQIKKDNNTININTNNNYSQQRILPLLIDNTSTEKQNYNESKNLAQYFSKMPNHTWSIYSTKQIKQNINNEGNHQKFNQNDIKTVFISLQHAYQFESSFKKIKKINMQNNELLRNYEVKFANKILAIIANLHIYKKYSYNQLRNFLISPYSYIANAQPNIQIVKSQENQLLLRQKNVQKKINIAIQTPLIQLKTQQLEIFVLT